MKTTCHAYARPFKNTNTMITTILTWRMRKRRLRGWVDMFALRAGTKVSLREKEPEKEEC